jgi:hypothetical protein
METIGLISVIIYGCFVYALFGNYSDFELLKNNCNYYTNDEIEEQIKQTSINNDEKEILRKLMEKKMQ